jgi:hypothetical protein
MIGSLVKSLIALFVWGAFRSGVVGVVLIGL